jgi:hypothetical protein
LYIICTTAATTTTTFTEVVVIGGTAVKTFGVFTLWTHNNAVLLFVILYESKDTKQYKTTYMNCAAVEYSNFFHSIPPQLHVVMVVLVGVFFSQLVRKFCY